MSLENLQQIEKSRRFPKDIPWNNNNAMGHDDIRNNEKIVPGSEKTAFLIPHFSSPNKYQKLSSFLIYIYKPGTALDDTYRKILEDIPFLIIIISFPKSEN